ncbi:Hypothetical predicted protein [Cloeon dipterum]|uniref:Bee-milk protein n=1 Tax=Cloeon dipterum TaxID=197152 RepID=A0A8S1CCU0_9INSE|nr:Hypothetical predicted protein [Cloeon dipterum]
MSPFFAAILFHGLCLSHAIDFTTVYEWDRFDFVWPSGADTSIEQINQKFIPDVEFRFMAVFGERLFLSLRMNDRIPATLVWLPTSGTSTAPKLAPFPSRHLHKQDNCDSIQRAEGMETDTDGWLWVLDNGSSKCPSKIWIFDLLSNNDTTIKRVHQFPDAVVSHAIGARRLCDIVLDKTQDDFLAYITDAESEQIVVYSRQMDKSWSVKTSGKWVSLALSPDREARQLYLRRYGSNELFSVSVSELKNEGAISAAVVKLVGIWTATPYRMLIDSANVLYAAFHNRNYLSKWNTAEPFREQRFHEVGDLGAHWPFTFALDANGILWMTERNETEGETETRHKLLKTEFGVRSYLFGPTGK